MKRFLAISIFFLPFFVQASPPQFDSTRMRCEVYFGVFSLINDENVSFGSSAYVTNKTAELKSSQDFWLGMTPSRVYQKTLVRTKEAQLNIPLNLKEQFNGYQGGDYFVVISGSLREGNIERDINAIFAYDVSLIYRNENGEEFVLGVGFNSNEGKGVPKIPEPQFGYNGWARHGETSPVEISNSEFYSLLRNKGIKKINYQDYGRSNAFAEWAEVRDRIGEMGNYNTWKTEFYPKVQEFLRDSPSNVIPGRGIVTCSLEKNS